MEITATSPADYEGLDTVVVFLVGSDNIGDMRCVNITIVLDDELEEDEMFTVTAILSPLPSANMIITIIDGSKCNIIIIAGESISAHLQLL